MSGLLVVLMVVACTVGEAPPEEPTPPADQPVDARPGDAGAGADPDAAPLDDDARAAELLAEAEQAYDDAELARTLELARRVTVEYPRTSSTLGARWVAARAAFALERYEQALELARSVASSARDDRLKDEARGLVELAEDALKAPAPAIVGAILPRSGSQVLVRYADWVLEGITLAVEQAEREQGRPVRLVVADDEGGARTREAMAELERQNVVGVIGPLLPQQLAVAADARRDSRLVLVSPTAPEAPAYLDQTYALNSGDGRGGGALGRWAADAGLRQATVLHARSPEFDRKARAFTEAFEALGGEVRAVIPYDSGTTTFGSHMERVLAAVSPLTGGIGEALPEDSVGAADRTVFRRQPFALFVAAPERDVPQIAPQVAFYGLDSAGVQVLGDDGWASATARRLVPSRDLEGVIAASPFAPDRASADTDPEFVRLYEARYRRSLDNELPALGYDAANLVLQALPNRMMTPSAVARRFALLAAIRGATGLLSVRSNQVVRTPYLVIIRGGRLEPAPLPWEYTLPVVKGSGGGDR